MGTNREFQGIYADGDSAPRKETGTPKAALRSKVLDPTVLHLLFRQKLE